MNSINDIVRVLSMLGALGVASQACQFPVPEAPPSLDVVNNKVEYFDEPGAGAFVDFTIWLGNINTAFIAAGAIRWSVEQNTAYIAPPSGSWGTGWPSPDEGTPGYAFNFATVYTDYARSRRTDTRGFGVFSVKGPSALSCNAPKRTLGVTTKGLPNDVPSDPKGRFSFLFYDRVQQFATNCTSHPRANVFVHVWTHELGHQRAGLSHTEEIPGMHHGDLPPGRRDVMEGSLITEQLRYRDAVFDYFPFDDCSGHGTCGANLRCWRTITN